MPQILVPAIDKNFKPDSWLVGWFSLCFPFAVHAQSTLSTALPLKRDSGTDVMSGSSIAVLLVLGIILVLCFYYANSRKKNTRQTNSSFIKRAWWTSLTPFSSDTSRLKIITTVRLTNQSALHEVQWNQKRILLVSSEHGVVKLDEMPAPAIDDLNVAPQTGAA